MGHATFTPDEVHAKLANFKAGIATGRMTIARAMEWCEDWLNAGILSYEDYLRMTEDLRNLNWKRNEDLPDDWVSYSNFSNNRIGTVVRQPDGQWTWSVARIKGFSVDHIAEGKVNSEVSAKLECERYLGQ